MATSAKFHAIRIEHDGRTQWYNQHGFGSLSEATLFPVREVGGESDSQGVYLQMSLMFPEATISIAAVDEVVKVTRVVRDIVE